MPSLGAGEIIVIFVLVLVLFGPNRLPELARGLGKAAREVRKITSDFQSQLAAITDIEDEPRPARARNAETMPALSSPPRLDQMSSTAPPRTPSEDLSPLDEPAAETPIPASAEPASEQGTLPFMTSTHLDGTPHPAGHMDSSHD